MGGVNPSDIVLSLFKWNVSESSPVGHVTASYATETVGGSPLRTRGTAFFDLSSLPPSDISGSFSYDPGDFISLALSRTTSAVSDVVIVALFEDDLSDI